MFKALDSDTGQKNLYREGEKARTLLIKNMHEKHRATAVQFPSAFRKCEGQVQVRGMTFPFMFYNGHDLFAFSARLDIHEVQWEADEF